MVHISTLYQRYMELVYGVCLKYFKDTEQCKDAVMDIFEELTVKLKVHEVENFKGWISVVTRNYCLMKLRNPKTIKTTAFNADFMQSAEITHLNSDILEKEENFNNLEQCLETLPADQKKCVQLFYLEQKCYKDIAEITGLDWNKVRSFIQNGKRNLKICMEQKNTSHK